MKHAACKIYVFPTDEQVIALSQEQFEKAYDTIMQLSLGTLPQPFEENGALVYTINGMVRDEFDLNTLENRLYQVAPELSMMAITNAGNLPADYLTFRSLNASPNICKAILKSFKTRLQWSVDTFIQN